MRIYFFIAKNSLFGSPDYHEGFWLGCADERIQGLQPRALRHTWQYVDAPPAEKRRRRARLHRRGYRLMNNPGEFSRAELRPAF